MKAPFKKVELKFLINELIILGIISTSLTLLLPKSHIGGIILLIALFILILIIVVYIILDLIFRENYFINILLSNFVSFLIVGHLFTNGIQLLYMVLLGICISVFVWKI